MKILGPSEVGKKGILLEYDAGYVKFDNSQKSINEMKDLDFTEDIILHAVLQKYDTPNKNGRIYPERLLKRENEKFQVFIEKKTSVGEMNHPNSSLLDLDRVSHLITETWWDGNILMGKLKLLLSPGWKKSGIVTTKGDHAAMLLMNGVTLGISSRGVGSLKNVNGQNVVQDDFELATWDLVQTPSTPGAYVFADVNDRDLYAESIHSNVNTQTQNLDKMKSLMGRLDSFLKK